MSVDLSATTDVLYSDECQTKKAFRHVERLLPLFRGVVKLEAKLLHTRNDKKEIHKSRVQFSRK